MLSVQCFAFYAIMSSLNKTVSYSRIRADNYKGILCADRGDATTETWKLSAVVSGCYFMYRVKCEAEST